MMYAELVKRLRELHPEEFGDAWDFAFACQQAMCEAADAIERLERELGLTQFDADNWKDAYHHWFENYQNDVPKWIPVTERLPEPGVPCLCWCKGGTYGQIRWYGLYYLTSHRTWAFYDNDCIDNREVTHWMYRPEPPKEERKDPCADCVHYPPSSTDGKPCCACDPANPLTNCHEAKEKTE